MTLGATILVAGCAARPDSMVPGLPVNGSNPGVRPQIVQTGQSPANWVQINLPFGGSDPHFLTTGPDNAVWIAQAISNDLARVAMDGSVIEYPVHTGGASAILLGTADKNFYVNDLFNNQFIQVDKHGVTKRFIKIPSGNGVNLFANGPNGNVWFMEFTGGINPVTVGEVTPGGVVTEHDVSHPNIGTITGGFDLVTGPDGNVWFTNNSEGSIANINPSTGVVTNYPMYLQGTACAPTFIVVGPDRRLWALCGDDINHKQYLVRMTTSGTATFTDLKTHGAFMIAVGPDKAVWGIGVDLIRFNPTSAKETRYPLPAGYVAARTLAAGPDGNVWVSDTSNTLGATSALVFVRRVLDVTPSSTTLFGTGQTSTLSVTEQAYSGTWTAKSSDTGVATVAPGSTSGTFVVTSVGVGTCTVTVADKKSFNTFPVKVTVNP
jgi:virginiamycin B lyase